MKEVFALTERTKNGETKTFWTKIGVAYDNKDGSITCKLDALPVSGQCQIREARPKPDAAPDDPKLTPF